MYYVVGGVAYGILQFIISWVAGELDAKGNQVSREVEIKTARVYHGGAAFVWPIIQGYEVMSMRPIQLNLTLKNALSAQNIRVTVPTTVTVAISQDPLIMQNAANYIENLGQKETTKATQHLNFLRVFLLRRHLKKCLSSRRQL